MNLRPQARYRRWAYGFAPYVYSQEIYKDTAIYYTDMETRRAARVAARRRRTRRRWWRRRRWRTLLDEPVAAGHVHVSGMTEAPDETAQGAWLDLVTKPGFSFLMAHVRYLRDGRFKVERIEEDGQRDSTSTDAVARAAGAARRDECVTTTRRPRSGTERARASVI